MSILEDYPLEKTGGETPAFIRKVVNYITKNINTPLSVGDIADVAGCSRYHFSRMFRESQGISPAAFVKEIRLQHAERLLQTTFMTINETAEACGFTDTSYFCKTFRRRFSVSPGKYRKFKVK
jgi:AraC family transcriptional regulator